MSSEFAARLLGLAFASADLLLELTPEGRIAFAAGAAEALGGATESALVGRHWRDLVAEPDQAMLEAFLEALPDGARAGPVVTRFTAGAGGAWRAFRAPSRGGRVSCAVMRVPPPQLGQSAGGLQTLGDFETGVRELLRSTPGEALEMALLDMDGLSAHRKKLPPADDAALAVRLAGALRAQSHGGQAAAELAPDRYALVRRSGEAAEVLAARVTGLLALGDAVRPTVRKVALDAGQTGGSTAKALRCVLDDFIEAGAGADTPATLAEALDQSMKRTLERARSLGAAVAERRFKLVYQPVVRLADRKLHHHEVLVRFGDAASPFPMIRMAEKLDMIQDLDLAVLDQTVKRLGQDPSVSLAVNISGRTITSDDFVPAVEAILAGRAALRPRLIFEITESAAIDDLAKADRHIQALRKGGSLVCLDDFGAGAASLAYLQQLRLDIVKIDGRYVRELQHGGREAAFVQHLARLCKDLGVRTVAEMIETKSVEDAIRRAGVDFGQGWLYGGGADAPGPVLPPAPSPAAARRVGAVEQWG